MGGEKQEDSPAAQGVLRDFKAGCRVEDAWASSSTVSKAEGRVWVLREGGGLSRTAGYAGTCYSAIRYLLKGIRMGSGTCTRARALY